MVLTCGASSHKRADVIIFGITAIIAHYALDDDELKDYAKQWDWKCNHEYTLQREGDSVIVIVIAAAANDVAARVSGATAA